MFGSEGICKESNKNVHETVMVTVIPPVTLILQLIEMTLSSIGNVNGIFRNMEMTVDPYFFLEQYVPHIDWAKFKQSNIKYQTKLS